MNERDLRRWRGLTWHGWLNYLVLRWFGWRIVRDVESDGTITSVHLRRWKGSRW